MANASEYVLNAYSFIKSSSLDVLLNVGRQSKEGNPIPSFDEKVLHDLCSEAINQFEREHNILEIEGDFIVVGDIHGSFHDLLRIVHYIEKVQTKVIFLGDYVDRGEFSLECITLLFAMKATHPDFIYLLRGNHEFDSICSQYGFKGEIIDYHNPKKVKKHVVDNNKNHKLEIMNYDFDGKNERDDDACDEYFANHNDMNCYKYSEELYEAFVNAFSYLPIAAILNGTTLCIHGGLSPKFEHLDDLRNGIVRPIRNFEENDLLSDVVWSDPTSNFLAQFESNPRGKGYLFNSKSVANFLNANNLKRIIRAHECVKHGSLSQFNEKCITVFSASSYGPEMENSSGLLKLLKEGDKVRFVNFPPIPRLRKSDAIYVKVQQFKKDEIDKYHFCFSLRHPTLAAANQMRIKSHESQHFFAQKTFAKPVFVTSSRKTIPAIRKPLTHSISVDGFVESRKAKSFQKNNEKHKSIFAAQSLLRIDEACNENDFTSFNLKRSLNHHENCAKSTGNLLYLNENRDEAYESMCSTSLLCPDENDENDEEVYHSLNSESFVCSNENGN